MNDSGHDTRKSSGQGLRQDLVIGSEKRDRSPVSEVAPVSLLVKKADDSGPLTGPESTRGQLLCRRP